ncbi:MAG: hypothetical protein RSG52_11170 [Terrisporobacter sp.]|uniref:hypothetical protein n=1 Tax=Terrisporobacter sp. TaxID=1965305 RepID=UPI002FC9B40A
MGIDKFLKDDLNEKEELVLRKKDYKLKVNKEVEHTFERDSFNLLNLDKEKKDTSKKVPMSIYFSKEDLDLLKAIAIEKNTTVNKILMSILKEPLNVTRENLPVTFDVNKKSKEYEVNSRKRNK